MPKPKNRQRAVQKRAEETKELIIATAIDLFSKQGYEGASIRAIELKANLKRGLVSYHFGTKEELWKAAMWILFDRMPTVSEDAKASMQDLPVDALFRIQVTRFVQASAAHPEISRVIIQEGRAHSWRLEFLLEHFIRPRVNWMIEASEFKLDAHKLYIIIGAATMVFDVAAECESLFGINPMEEGFVREHAKQVCDMLLGQS